MILMPTVLTPFSSKLYLLDGLTTPMDMELGARDVDKWYRERAGKSQVNYATTVSHTLARIHVMDGDEAGLAANDIIDLDAAVEASQKNSRRRGLVANWPAKKSSIS